MLIENMNVGANSFAHSGFVASDIVRMNSDLQNIRKICGACQKEIQNSEVYK